MDEQNDTVTDGVAASITLGQTIYDVESENRTEWPAPGNVTAASGSSASGASADPTGR